MPNFIEAFSPAIASR